MVDDQLPARRGRGLGAVKPGPGEVVRFANHLRELQGELQVTQDELARRLHVSPSTLSRYMSGERVPEREFLLGIYGMLGKRADLADPAGDFKHSVEILFAAKERKEPLSHRIWILELAKERLENEIKEGRDKAASLERKLKEEISRRCELEAELDELRSEITQRAADRHRMGELQELRVTVDEKVHELEGVLRQQRSVVTLLEGDREKLSSALGDAERQASLNSLIRTGWSEGEGQRWAQDGELKEHVVQQAGELFDEGESEKGDNLLSVYARGIVSGQLVEFVVALYANDRRPAAMRLLSREVSTRSVSEVIKLMRKFWEKGRREEYSQVGIKEVDFILDSFLAQRGAGEIAKLLNAMAESDIFDVSEVARIVTLGRWAVMFPEIYPVLSSSVREMYLRKTLEGDSRTAAAAIIWLSLEPGADGYPVPLSFMEELEESKKLAISKHLRKSGWSDEASMMAIYGTTDLGR
ncbi:helix-turn-helix domain-containing protein [Streptomyces sp. BH-SS-21]|uniref:Helix-turn-helix domain-containing protein n=1 Tax=Streptomyces liliiviolaceus TaxID=2823109 RepID=A0A940XL59_9ACTN|nr:helix-turn-helix domain-containing protein [Streptomyces liliiviolaceus]MBQ0847999.1 helix-turn-helix domain-containing protein [Streptomyces liliiviolaceus]